MTTGGCNCGAVRFELRCDLSDLYMCHCSICRRLTGSAGIPVAVVRNEDFAWLSGEDQIATWMKPDADWQCWFCRRCGSPLPGENDPERRYVPAGLLDGQGEGLQIRHHIWVGSKAHWDQIGDAGKQHPTRFGG